jgi:5-methylcytosine-specific restriction protein A
MPNRTKNPIWTRDESILALDLYLKCKPSLPGDEDERVIALSNLLNNLPIHPNNVRGQNFRNPDGVTFKLGNFRHIDPEDPARAFQVVPTRIGRYGRSFMTSQKSWPVS